MHPPQRKNRTKPKRRANKGVAKPLYIMRGLPRIRGGLCASRKRLANCTAKMLIYFTILFFLFLDLHSYLHCFAVRSHVTTLISTKQQKNAFRRFPLLGGDKRVRTADLLNAIQALYQLSYTPKRLLYSIMPHRVCQLFAINLFHHKVRIQYTTILANFTLPISTIGFDKYVTYIYLSVIYC